MTRSSLLVVAVLSLMISCDKGDGATASPDESAGGSDTEASADGAEDGGEGEAMPAWADMNGDQKKKHMMSVVVPEMSGVFQGMNAERYAEFNCVTCHGEGAKQGEFAMPSPDLPKLSPNGDFSAEMERSPQVVEFMMKQVVPEMAGALGVEPYSPENQDGLGCYTCHQTNG